MPDPMASPALSGDSPRDEFPNWNKKDFRRSAGAAHEILHARTKDVRLNIGTGRTTLRGAIYAEADQPYRAALRPARFSTYRPRGDLRPLRRLGQMGRAHAGGAKARQSLLYELKAQALVRSPGRAPGGDFPAARAICDFLARARPDP